MEMEKPKIPEGLVRRIEALENNIKSRGKGEIAEKIAVFDLDNTLLIGDIGDAVFAQLLLDKFPMPFTWQQYRDLIREKKKKEAYERVVTTMAGITVDKLIETTRRIMYSDLSFLKLAEAEVPVPVPHPVMAALLELLKYLEYKIFVISATNQYSVRFVAREFFNLPAERVFGINPVVEKKVDPGGEDILLLGDTLQQPVTVAQGKADLYRKYIGTKPPFIAAGDSESDIPMLNLVENPGLVLWVGIDDKKYAIIQGRVKHPGNLYYFRR